MNCREVQDQLIEFYEDQLGRRDAEQIRGHLGMCPGCREELRAIEKVINGLKSQRLPDPGEAFWRDFPKRVRKAFYEGDRPIRVPILQRVWEVIHGSTKWLPLSKPVGAAVSIAAVVLVIAGLLFFKAGWFWTGSRDIGEEILESYYGGIGVVVSTFTPGSLEDLSSYQLEDISTSQAVFVQLEGLNSEELDFVYDALKKRYFKSTTSFSMQMG